MKIGFPTNPSKDICSEIDWIARNDFDFADIYLECPLMPGLINVTKVKKMLESYGLAATGHLGWYLPTGSPDRSIRKAAAEESEMYFQVFEKLGVRLVTIHASWEPGFTPEQCIKFQAETLGKIIELARGYGIRIMYELSDTPYDTVENTTKVLDMVPGLLFHLDIGHANLHGKNPEDFIKALHRRLVHVHLHDNDGRFDMHLPIGEGKIKWKPLIETLKKYYDGTITLEIFSKDKSLVLESRKALKELWNAR